MSSDSTVVRPYLLTIRVLPQKDGVNVPQLIRKISGVLAVQEKGTRVLHNLKVTGEAKLFVFVEVSNKAGLERTLGKLWELGPLDIECTPLVHYEKFARNMEVSDELCKDIPANLGKDGLYVLIVDIEYKGKPFKDFMALWKKEAETVLDMRCKGLSNLRLFKSVTQRQVILIMNVDEPHKLDKMSFQLPIMIENGENIKMRSKEVQETDDYIKQLSS